MTQVAGDFSREAKRLADSSRAFMGVSLIPCLAHSSYEEVTFKYCFCCYRAEQVAFLFNAQRRDNDRACHCNTRVNRDV